VIREFSWAGRDILRRTPAHAGDDPLDAACFPMVPFANRIANGRFEFGGRAVRLSRNWSEDPHPLHGQGWRARWTVIESRPSGATIRFDGGADEWPWAYRCEQQFELGEDGLSIELSVHNLSESPMPAMLGLHPYFPDPARARLRAQLSRVWLTDDAALPLREAETPKSWRFEPAAAMDTAALDHCFSGWNGLATLQWPDRTVRVRGVRCGCLHIYSPAARDFFCIEPQSAPAGALGRGAGEMNVLGPGERFSIRVDFEIGAP
jgi:aldose 1-epimerase